MTTTDMTTLGPEEVYRAASRKAARRLVPLLALLLFVNYLDRVNVGFAAPTMNPDIEMTTTAYGVGVAVFFIGYVLLEVPSNYAMYRIGARRWLARIAITWGLVAALHAAVTGPATFAAARVLLGVTEAGLLPGILWYISRWFSGRERVLVLGTYYVAVPLSTAIGGPLSNWLIHHGTGSVGLVGWRLMFATEGLAAVALGIVILFLLPNSPADARWLTPAEQQALIARTTPPGDTATGTHSFRGALKSATTLRLAGAFFFLVFPMFSISFFLPLIATGLSDASDSSVVDLVTFVPFALGAVASVAWTHFAQRRLLGARHFALPTAVAAIGVAVCSLSGNSGPVLLLGVVLAAVGIYAAIPVFWSIASATLSGAAAAASGLALINTVGSLGGFAAGYVTGWLRGITGGYAVPFLLMAASLALSAVVAGGLRQQIAASQRT